MNYLAHVFLSGERDEHRLGGYLGDFIKGPIAIGLTDVLGTPWSVTVVEGVRLHRLIDARVDALPEFKGALSRLGERHRRVGGIALDVFFDHLLSRHWDEFSSQPLTDFNQRFYALCLDQRDRLPDRALRFIEAAQRYDLFSGYGDIEMVESVLERIGERLRTPHKLNDIYPVLLDQYQSLESDFFLLMPKLIEIANQELSRYEAVR